MPGLTNKEGILVNAVYGFSSTVLRFLKDYRPDYAVAAFDVKGPTFRHEITDEYKANRGVPPDDLIPQFAIVRKIAEEFGFSTYSQEGYEADDVIGSFAERYKKEDDIRIIILTGDNDILQLVDDKKVYVYTFGRSFSKGTLYDRKKVIEKYGFGPEFLVDYKALRGDPSDNIKGIAGIGEKTATDLIQKFGSIESIYKNIETKNFEELGIKKRPYELLKEGKDNALESKLLATIVRDLNVELSFDELKLNFRKKDLKESFIDLGFSSLIKRVDNMDFLPEQEEAFTSGQNQLFQISSSEKTVDETGHANLSATYKTVTVKNFDEFLQKLSESEVFAFDTETDSLNSLEAKIIGLSFAMSESEAFYLPFGHSSGENLGFDFLEKLKPIFFESSKLKIAHNLKYDLHVLENYGFKISAPIYDTMIANHLITCGQNESNSLDFLAEKYFGHSTVKYSELFDEGEKDKNFAKTKISDATKYSGEDSLLTFRFWEHQKDVVKDFRSIFEIEMKILPILAQMERVGIGFDKNKAKEISGKFESGQKEIYEKVREFVDYNINLNSPKEISKLLFEILKLPTKGIRKTSLGYTTNEKTLEKLREYHPVVAEIISHRHLEKMRNTYLEKLPRQIEGDGRIHTQFNQSIVPSGRISSSNPNLQAIPTRTSLGKMVRSCFVAKSGWKFASIDYSQIELRLLAILSGDKNLLSAFSAGEDIHRKTASFIFEKEISEITEDERGIGKTINFSIVYGVSSYGLGKSLGIEPEMASIFIDRFFTAYSEAKNWLDRVKTEAYENGFVKTHLGRRIFVSLLNSPNGNLQKQGERQAINFPLQGTASEILKTAMIDVSGFIREKNLKSRLVSQIHDEVVLEVPEGELEFAEKFKEIVKFAGRKIVDAETPVDLEICESL